MIHCGHLLRCLALVVVSWSPLPSPSVRGAAQAPQQQDALVGTWDGTFEPPGVVGGDPFSLLIATIEGEHVRGTLVLPEGTRAFEGKFERARGALTFDTELGG